LLHCRVAGNRNVVTLPGQSRPGSKVCPGVGILGQLPAIAKP
jgi:hypothetical protein